MGKSYLSLGLGLVFLFSGCTAIKNEVSAKTDSAMIAMNEQEHNVKAGYENTKHVVYKSYLDITDSIDSLTNSFYENSFVQFFVPDETILSSRDNLIVWKAGNSDDSSNIISNYLEENKSNVDPQGLDLSQKIKILNEYFFGLKEKKYIENFSSKNPIPKMDEFKSDRENIVAANEYKFKLMVAKNEWDLNLKEIRKEIAAQTLSSLYGTPKITKVTYNPNYEEIFLNIESEINGFSQKITFDLDSNMAKKMKNDMDNLKPVLYYSIENDNLKLIGVSVVFKKKNYLARFTDELYQNNNNIKFTSNGLNVEKVDLDYAIVSKNVEPPEWFYNVSSDKTIGYGMGDTEQEAKNAALREITQQLGVIVNSQTTSSKKSDGTNFSRRVNQDVNVKTNDFKLVGTKTIKSQKKDGVWFIAVSK